jgi:hypothetical protein
MAVARLLVRITGPLAKPHLCEIDPDGENESAEAHGARNAACNEDGRNGLGRSQKDNAADSSVVVSALDEETMQ